jgi:hypothetical protein
LDVVGAGTPIAMEFHPEKAQFPNLGDYLHGKGGVFKVIIYEGHELLIHEPSHRIPSDLLFVAEKVIYTQKIQALKFGHCSLHV